MSYNCVIKNIVNELRFIYMLHDFEKYFLHKSQILITMSGLRQVHNSGKICFIAS
jgi:hypothetical protein